MDEIVKKKSNLKTTLRTINIVSINMQLSIKSHVGN